MSSTPPEDILDAIFAALDAGRAPDQAELRARFPGQETTIARLTASVAQYVRRRNELVGEAPALPPGTQLGDFVIEGLLRRGGMGVVYRARQRSLGDRLVALKVVPGGADDPVRERRFQREASLAASLHHEHLVEVHGFGHERGLYFCAMRLVEGPSLQDVLDRLVRARLAGVRADRDERRRLVRLAAQVGAALAVMHRAGLVHRDVKPANIVLDGSATDADLVPDATAILVDFGLARAVDAATLTASQHASATVSYAPPEQLLGQDDVDGSADVFALGVTLHDLLCARGPHERLQASAGLQPLRELLPEADRDLCAVLAKATDPLPRWRYADGAALHADLAAWLEGAPVTARALRAHQRAVRWTRRHPSRVLRLLLVVLAAAAVLVLVVRVSETLRLAGEMRRARDGGDLAALSLALDQLDQRPLAPLVLDASERALVATLGTAAAGETGPAGAGVSASTDADARAAEAKALRAIARPLVEGRDEEALAALGRSLVTRAGRLDGLLRAHVLHRLAVPDDADTVPPSLGPSLALVARAFYERPDVTPQDAADSEPLRARLAQLLGDARLSHQARLDALWALSGCGTPDLLVAADGSGDDLSAWVLRQPRDGEERRMGLLCLEHILRRAARCGLRGQLSPEQADRLDGRVARLLTESAGEAWEQRHAGELLGPAWAFFRRARGERASLPEDWLAGRGLDVRTHLAIAVGDAGGGEGPCLTAVALPADWRHLGWHCGASRDPEAAIDAGLQRLQPLLALPCAFPGPMLASFLAGADIGVAEAGGRRTAEEPDPASRLQYTGDAMPRTLPAGWSPEPLPRPTVAEWAFRWPAAQLRGVARAPVTGVLVNEGGLVEGDPCVVLRVFGGSELRLRFVVEGELAAVLAREAEPIEPRLLLEHLGALRSTVPLGGRALLEIQLDGVDLTAGLAVPTPSLRVDSVPVARAQLTPGEHELVLRLAIGSTTTYRLGRVALQLGR